MPIVTRQRGSGTTRGLQPPGGFRAKKWRNVKGEHRHGSGKVAPEPGNRHRG